MDSKAHTQFCGASETLGEGEGEGVVMRYSSRLVMVSQQRMQLHEGGKEEGGGAGDGKGEGWVLSGWAACGKHAQIVKGGLQAGRAVSAGHVVLLQSL